MPFKDPEKQREYHREWCRANKRIYGDPEARRAYHREWSRLHKKYGDDWWKDRRKRNQELLRTQKRRPCADCGVSYPHYVMDFHHRDPSEKDVTPGTLKGAHWSEKRILAELAKCDVVCSNCHRERHWGVGAERGVASKATAAGFDS